MKNKFLLTTSALILMGTTSAMANNNVDKPHVETMTQAEVEANWEATKEGVSNAWENTKETVSDAAETVSDASKEAYNETAAMLDTKTDIDTYIQNESRLTAYTVMNQDLYNQQGETIASVSDIVLDRNGDIRGLIVEHGGVMGIGEKDVMVGIDNLNARTDKSGYVTNMTDADFETTAEFDDDTMDQSLYLASDLLDADIVDEQMSELAEVDNIVIEDGNATKLIVSYLTDKQYEKALIDFTDADIVVDTDSDAQFKLSMNEASEFNKFKYQ